MLVHRTYYSTTRNMLRFWAQRDKGCFDHCSKSEYRYTAWLSVVSQTQFAWNKHVVFQILFHSISFIVIPTLIRYNSANGP